MPGRELFAYAFNAVGSRITGKLFPREGDPIMGIHDGHRQRMRRRFLRSGLEGFDDLAILELILFYAIPRQDTNPIAHRLIDRYNTLAAVLEAPVGELQKIEGIGESTAILLSLFPAVARRHIVERSTVSKAFDTYEKIGDYLKGFFHGARDELVYLLCLDGRLMELDCRLLFHGSINSAGISVRRIAETALSCGAVSAVLAHNHPGGLALPSLEDEQTTERVRAALETLDIRLIDHIIVAGDDYISMVQSGYVFV